MGAYGLHRGFFAKKFPETSFRPQYFVPSAFLLFTGATAALPLMPVALTNVFFAGWVIYGFALLAALAGMTRHESFAVSISALPYVFLTHLVYGARFLQGFAFTGELVSELR